MGRRTRAVRIVALCVVVSLLAAGCGGDQDNGGAEKPNEIADRNVSRPLAPIGNEPTPEAAEFAFGPRPTPMPSVNAAPATSVVLASNAQLLRLGPTARPSKTTRPSRTPRPTRTPRLTRTPRPTSTPRPTKTPRDSDAGSDSRDNDPPATERSAASDETPTADGPTDPRATPPPPTAPSAPTEDNSLLARLRRGGYVIYLRHTSTDWSQSEREEEWIKEVLEDIDNSSLYRQCDRQRLLSDAGRDEARAIGAEFQNLGIPVGRVLTSPWCRTQETAQLAFGKATVARGRLFDTGYLPDSDVREQFEQELKRLLSERPSGRRNTVLVGHMPQMLDATGIALGESQATVVRPEGGGFKVEVEAVSPGGWAGLAQK